MRQQYHLYLLREVRELVESGIVLGYAAEGDDIETVHARFFKRIPMLDNVPAKDTVDRLYYRDAEVKIIDDLIAKQKAVVAELGIEIPAEFA